MLRINRMRRQILSLGIGSTRSFISSLSLNSGERYFSQLVRIAIINGNRLAPRSIDQCPIANQTDHFSTMAETILVQARDPAKLSLEIQLAIDEHRYDDAWRIMEQCMEEKKFPSKSVVNKLIVAYSETLDSILLDRMFGLVERIFEEGKENLFEKETLIYLALALARCNQPVPSSTILRKLISMGEYPPVGAWSAILAYMSLSSSGAYLSAQLILEIGSLVQDNRIDTREKSNASLIAMKPNTLAISVVVAGCVVSGTTRIAAKVLDMNPIGAYDTLLLVLKAHVYGRNGRITPLVNLKREFDKAHGLNDIQVAQYYNFFLDCCLKTDNMSTACEIVLEMLQKAKEASNSLSAATLRLEPTENGSSSCVNVSDTKELCTSDKGESQPSSFMSFEEFCRDREFVCLEAETKKILMSLSLKLQKQEELIITERGILQVTEEAYVKIAKACLESDYHNFQLGRFLMKVDKEDSLLSVEDSAFVDVFNVLISPGLGWLDQAHDLLVALFFPTITTDSSLYSSLVKACLKEKRMRMAIQLMRDAQEAGIELDSSCYETLSQSGELQGYPRTLQRLKNKVMKEAKLGRGGREESKFLAGSSSKSGDASFKAKLLKEIREGDSYFINDRIRDLCRRQLMQDAENLLQSHRSKGHIPNAQTFHAMITGYEAIGGKYIEVAKLWDEMKSLAAATLMKFDQELLDSVLYIFVKGGFFVQANEVAKAMEEGNMLIDKYRYRNVFLKYHKTLSEGEAPDFQTEAQMKERDATLAFKKLVGLL